MVKVCVSFKNSLFVWVYLKEICFFRGCFHLVFILQNFGSLAPLIFLNSFFYQNLFSLLWNTAYIFFLQAYIFLQNINLFLKTIIFNIKQFDIPMGYNFNFLSNNVNGLNSSKKRIKMLEYFREKIAKNGILSLQETHSSHDTVINEITKFGNLL